MARATLFTLLGGGNASFQVTLPLQATCEDVLQVVCCRLPSDVPFSQCFLVDLCTLQQLTLTDESRALPVGGAFFLHSERWTVRSFPPGLLPSHKLVISVLIASWTLVPLRLCPSSAPWQSSFDLLLDPPRVDTELGYSLATFREELLFSLVSFGHKVRLGWFPGNRVHIIPSSLLTSEICPLLDLTLPGLHLVQASHCLGIGELGEDRLPFCPFCFFSSSPSACRGAHGAGNSILLSLTPSNIDSLLVMRSALGSVLLALGVDTLWPPLVNTSDTGLIFCEGLTTLSPWQSLLLLQVVRLARLLCSSLSESWADASPSPSPSVRSVDPIPTLSLVSRCVLLFGLVPFAPFTFSVPLAYHYYPAPMSHASLQRSLRWFWASALEEVESLRDDWSDSFPILDALPHVEARPCSSFVNLGPVPSWDF